MTNVQNSKKQAKFTLDSIELIAWFQVKILLNQIRNQHKLHAVSTMSTYTKLKCFRTPMVLTSTGS